MNFSGVWLPFSLAKHFTVHLANIGAVRSFDDIFPMVYLFNFNVDDHWHGKQGPLKSKFFFHFKRPAICWLLRPFLFLINCLLRNGNIRLIFSTTVACCQQLREENRKILLRSWWVYCLGWWLNARRKNSATSQEYISMLLPTSKYHC